MTREERHLVELLVQDIDPNVDPQGAERQLAVLYFAVEMRKKLFEPRNIAKGGWRNDSLQDLLHRLSEETDELTDEIRNYVDRDYDAIVSEAADVANFALMVADVAARQKV